MQWGGDAQEADSRREGSGRIAGAKAEGKLEGEREKSEVVGAEEQVGVWLRGGCMWLKSHGGWRVGRQCEDCKTQRT